MSDELINKLIEIDKEHDKLLYPNYPQNILDHVHDELIHAARKCGPEWIQEAINSRQEQIFQEEERILKCL